MIQMRMPSGTGKQGHLSWILASVLSARGIISMRTAPSVGTAIPVKEGTNMTRTEQLKQSRELVLKDMAKVWMNWSTQHNSDLKKEMETLEQMLEDIDNELKGRN